MQTTTTKHGRSKPGRVELRFAMHPEIHRKLKAEAAMAGYSLVEYAHRLFCSALGREDLADHAPNYRGNQ